LVLAAVVLASAAFAQQTGVLKGQVTDSSGAVIPGALVTVKGPGGAKNVSTGADGNFAVNGLAPGKYDVHASSTGFSPYENKAVEVGLQPTALNVKLDVAATKEEVTVQGGPGLKVSTEADNNASALILRNEDLDALPDDPDDLAADLQALAGPSAGPSGGQIFVDGFSGAQLPPKESIREIRINQNPFAAEYDTLGFGRIEILTKPGSDKFHGQTFFSFGDDEFNTRNPYAANKAPYQTRMYGGNLGGPLSKRASFYFDFERREIDDDSIIHATTIDTSLNLLSISQAVQTPNRRTSISPRLDYQLSANHTLVMKYTYFHYGQDNNGIGELSLQSREYHQLNTGQTFQATETAVLGPKAVNETRFQFLRSNIDQTGDNTLPGISVQQAFLGGGAQIGNSYNVQDHFELQNYTTLTLGAHAVKFGVRMRYATDNDMSPANFSGTYTFAGGLEPMLDANNQVVMSGGQPVLQQLTSLQQYQRTLQLQNLGYDPATIRTLGGGPSQFSIATGNPLMSVNQIDVGPYIQDDWRARPNLTVSVGLRYENQNNIHDNRDFAPRAGFAWAPGGTASKPGLTVIRGGFGMFYARFDQSLVLNSLRFNGQNEQQYIVNAPAIYSPSPFATSYAVAAPTIASLQNAGNLQTIYQVSPNLRAPCIMQSAIGVERQLPHNTTISSTYTNSHGTHQLLTRDIDAPVDGVAPFPAYGHIFEYESAGLYNQNQWMTTLNSRFNSKVTIFAYYVFNHSMSNTDSVTTQPANQYNLADEYGRSALDIRHRVLVGGSIVAPKAIRLSPFFLARTGAPYNITTGDDLGDDSVYTDRPALVNDPALVAADPARYRVTPLGTFDLTPGPGEAIIPRNFAQGPGYVSMSLRVSRTWGFGPSRNGNYNTADSGGGHDHGGSRGGSSGMRPSGSSGSSIHSLFSDSVTEKRYNLTASVQGRNILNHTNGAAPIGNLTSPLFGQSIASANSYGADRAQAGNRRLEFQLRFSF
jgi:hypothetical protein